MNQDLTIDNFQKKFIDIGSITGVSDFYGLSRNSIYSFLKRNGVTDVKNYLKDLSFQQDYFNNIDSSDKAYWLGFIYADGYVFSPKDRLGINLHVKDIEHLHKFKKSLKSTQKVRIVEKNNTCNITHHSKKLLEDLKQHGCIDKKSLVLVFPKIEDCFLFDFIRGYYDGDGCITNNCNGKMRLNVVGTESFLTTLQNIFYTKLDIPKRKLHTTGKAFVLEHNGNKQATKIADTLYKDANIYLDRKYEKYKSML